MKKVAKKSWKVVKWVLLAVVVLFTYLFVTAVLPFVIMEPEEADTTVEPEVAEETGERVALMDYGPDAWNARINMIDAAEETLDISYFYMEDGSSVQLFYAHVLEAADRGVEVRFLMDGIFHGMRGDDSAIVDVFTEHPNIELKFYEPLDLLRPWTLNNRMHDKFILVDGQYAKTGGRNIGNRYFIRESYEEEYSYDRDILIMNPEDSSEGTVIEQIEDYFELLWDAEFTESQTDEELSDSEREEAAEHREEIEEWLEKSRELTADREIDYDMEDWWERGHEINSGYIVYNSIDRGQKEPWIWQDMLRLVENAEENIFVQSPWMIPDRHMRQDLENAQENFTFDEGVLLTNGRSANHNPGAQSGTENHREAFVEAGYDLYEYQPPESSLHMKTLIVDEEIVAVGAYNFDGRSSYLNTDNMVVLDSPGLAEEILETVEKSYMPRSPQIDEDGNEIDDGEVIIREEPFWKRIWVPMLRPLTRIFESLM